MLLNKKYYERLKVINEEILNLNVLSRIKKEHDTELEKQIDILELQLKDLRKNSHEDI